MRWVFPINMIAAALLAGCVATAEPSDGGGRFPRSDSYPSGTMEHATFVAGVPEAWRIATLRTPERPEATWKVVVITGTPSWSEFWAPTIAAMPSDWEMVVADRPGFAGSEPQGAVPELVRQADALAPMLEARPGERVLLVGQSFGAPVATLMAQRYPERVDALLMVSAFFGDRGPTARRLIGLGGFARPILSRDLKNSISEVTAQPAQLPEVWSAFASLRQPVVFIHGDNDSFVPLAADQRIAEEHGRTLIAVPGGDHFLNACCVPALVAAMQQAIAEAEAAPVPVSVTTQP